MENVIRRRPVAREDMVWTNTSARMAILALPNVKRASVRCKLRNLARDHRGVSVYVNREGKIELSRWPSSWEQSVPPHGRWMEKFIIE